MTPEEALIDVVEFWKKTQKINLFLLRRIAAHAEMANRAATEILVATRGNFETLLLIMFGVS